MKFLQVIASLNPASGGPVNFSLQFAKNMSHIGHPVDTITLDSPDVPWLANSTLPIFPLGPSWANQRYCKKLVPWLEQYGKNYQAIIVRGLWQYSGLGVWLAWRKQGFPYFVYPHGMLDPWFKYNYPLKHLKKWLYWPWGEYQVLRAAQAVLFTSQSERLRARDSFWLYTCKEETVCYGIEYPPSYDKKFLRSIFLKKFSHLTHKKIILFLGRIHPKKGCDILLKAYAKVLAQYNQYHLLMVGPDELRWGSQLQKMSQQLRIQEQVTWAGMLQGQEKWACLQTADVLILPSHQENFGIVVAESLACGTPVLLSDKVNICEEVKQARAGLVEQDTQDGIALLLKTWHELTEQKRQVLRENAKICFEKNFRLENAIQNFLQVVQKYIE